MHPDTASRWSDAFWNELPSTTSERTNRIVRQSKRAMEESDQLNGRTGEEERFLATWRQVSRGKRGAKLFERGMYMCTYVRFTVLGIVANLSHAVGRVWTTCNVPTLYCFKTL